MKAELTNCSCESLLMNPKRRIINEGILTLIGKILHSDISFSSISHLVKCICTTNCLTALMSGLNIFLHFFEKKKVLQFIFFPTCFFFLAYFWIFRNIEIVNLRLGSGFLCSVGYPNWITEPIMKKQLWFTFGNIFFTSNDKEWLARTTLRKHDKNSIARKNLTHSVSVFPFISILSSIL